MRTAGKALAWVVALSLAMGLLPAMAAADDDTVADEPAAAVEPEAQVVSETPSAEPAGEAPAGVSEAAAGEADAGDEPAVTESASETPESEAPEELAADEAAPGGEPYLSAAEDSEESADSEDVADAEGEGGGEDEGDSDTTDPSAGEEGEEGEGDEGDEGDDLQALEDGTYVFAGATSSTGMVNLDPEDGPVRAIVDGDAVTLVVDVYTPAKYDKLFAGKRSEAPDSLSAGLIEGQFVLAGGYAGDRNWTDANGLVGPAGNTYKAVRFFIPFPKDDFQEAVESGGDLVQYYAIRCSSWSPNNPLQWMDDSSGNYYLTIQGPVAKVDDSTQLPATGFTPPADPEPVSLDKVKALIEALPVNPYDVTWEDAEQIEESKVAYDALSQEEQERLDAEYTPLAQTYGRTLESAVWALAALESVDNATTLADGIYTLAAGASTCSMGKSLSRRGFKFTAKSLYVKDGRVTALIEFQTNSPDTIRIGGKEYAHVNTDDKQPSQFVIPVCPNEPFHFSQMAKDATENTVAIAYEMEITIDEATATPDKEQASDAKEQTGARESSADGGKKPVPDIVERAAEKQGDAAQDNGDGNAGGKKAAQRPAGARGTNNNAAALAAVAAARSQGAVGKARTDQAKQGAADGQGAKNGSGKKDAAAGSGGAGSSSAGKDGAEGAAGSGLLQLDQQIEIAGFSLNLGPFALVALAVLALLGIASFVVNFYRREARLKG